uniref:Major facilitator superfamily (MFS) profile domain-containing protein n=1 Tax=Fagus sylvatica TaxID=28930 RepID=A0A2N9I930_FAGSY
MGIAVNLVTYLVGTMHLPSSTSANIVTDFMCASFLLCLLGGFLADSFLGRFYTIAIFAVIQALGTGALAISTKLPQLRPPPCGATVTHCQKANGLQMGTLYIALHLIALGIGGIKSSVSGFGTDQFDEEDEKEKAQMAYFFNSFLDKASIVAEGDIEKNAGSAPNPWKLCSVTRVEDDDKTTTNMGNNHHILDFIRTYNHLFS